MKAEACNIFVPPSQSSIDEDRLVADLFNGYNSLIRPVPNATSPPIEVSFSLALVLLINIDEKNQIMHTNVWPTMRWKDYQMRWDPRTYGSIETIRVPPDKVWLPDIVLFNNADGNYLVSFYSNVVVEHTGEMLWVPPAVYKSSCIIDVEYFPFDEQVCSLTFGSWTFKKEEVQISYHMGKRQVELNDYSFSGIWDVMEVPGLLIEDRSKISYQIRIRRKTLFYTVILIMPTVLMAFLSMMVFYLPCEASEKITLAISILLALVVFLLLVSKILPPTSSTIPLMAKYLLMTFVMNMITIMVTVVIINVYFRGPATHTMPNWVRTLFLKHLPMLLIMRRPESTEQELRRAREAKRERRSIRGVVNAIKHQAVKSVPSNGSGDVEDEMSPLSRKRESEEVLDARRSQEVDPGLSNEATQAIEAIEYITRHLTRDNDYKRQCDEWKYVSMVLDRLLLYVFFAATTGGTMGVLFSAPNVFEYVDQAAVIQNLKQAAAAEQNIAGFSP
ncbi:Cation transporter family protein [Ancylostoma caninum]|uniref:Cation transporter family protein n=2 Tax=Ancylostoma TaxID=29169 RepID=A0A368FH91_ANCCA|nr:Cation transporter family protein [Ancylostoma caninum]